LSPYAYSLPAEPDYLTVLVNRVHFLRSGCQLKQYLVQKRKVRLRLGYKCIVRY